MTRYQKYMQHIHDQATAKRIEDAVIYLSEDIIDYLVKTGVKQDSKLINEILGFKNYKYEPSLRHNEPCAPA